MNAAPYGALPLGSSGALFDLGTGVEISASFIPGGEKEKISSEKQDQTPECLIWGRAGILLRKNLRWRPTLFHKRHENALYF